MFIRAPHHTRGGAARHGLLQVQYSSSFLVSMLAAYHFGLNKILFHFKALLWQSIILLLPPPTYKAYPIAILLHDHCAIHARPPTPPVYAIRHTIFVMAISCKGQMSLVGCLPGARYLSASALALGLYKIFVWFEAFVQKSILLFVNTPSCLGTPPPPCIAHTIVQYGVSPDHLVLQELPYNIGNGNIV